MYIYIVGHELQLEKSNIHPRMGAGNFGIASTVDLEFEINHYVAPNNQVIEHFHTNSSLGKETVTKTPRICNQHEKKM